MFVASLLIQQLLVVLAAGVCVCLCVCVSVSWSRCSMRSYRHYWLLFGALCCPPCCEHDAPEIRENWFNSRSVVLLQELWPLIILGRYKLQAVSRQSFVHLLLLLLFSVCVCYCVTCLAVHPINSRANFQDCRSQGYTLGAPDEPPGSWHGVWAGVGVLLQPIFCRHSNSMSAERISNELRSHSQL